MKFKKSDSNTWSSAEAVERNATVLSNTEQWDGLFLFRVTAVNQFGSAESSEVSVTLRGRINLGCALSFVTSFM